MTKPDEKPTTQSEAEVDGEEQLKDEDLENVTGGALNLTGTGDIADLRSVRISKRPGRVKTILP